jgi:hypothetical protein
MSAACEKVYGYSAEEFFAGDGNLWYDVILEEDRYIIENMDMALKAGACSDPPVPYQTSRRQHTVDRGQCDPHTE